MGRFGLAYLGLMAAVTTALMVLMQVVAGSDPGGDNGLVAMVVLPLPLVLSVLWGWAVMAAFPGRALVVAGGVAVLLAALLEPGPMIAQAAVNMAAGLGAGWALRRRLRPDAALVLCAGILVPMTVWSVRQVGVAEQMALLRQDMTTVIESRIPESATPQQRQEVLDRELKKLDAVLDVLTRIYPAMLAVGLLTQALLILGLVWMSARITGGLTQGRRFGSFARFRVPFGVVWLFIAGLGLIVTRAEPAATVGLNLALLAALVLSIQGIAVQVEVLGRMLSPAGRMMYWLVMGMFFAPLVVAAGVLLGLADQWLDFRKLDAAEVEEDEKVV